MSMGTGWFRSRGLMLMVAEYGWLVDPGLGVRGVASRCRVRRAGSTSVRREGRLFAAPHPTATSSYSSPLRTPTPGCCQRRRDERPRQWRHHRQAFRRQRDHDLTADWNDCSDFSSVTTASIVLRSYTRELQTRLRGEYRFQVGVGRGTEPAQCAVESGHVQGPVVTVGGDPYRAGAVPSCW